MSHNCSPETSELLPPLAFSTFSGRLRVSLPKHIWRFYAVTQVTKLIHDHRQQKWNKGTSDDAQDAARASRRDLLHSLNVRQEVFEKVLDSVSQGSG
jgi:hypothetical protein